MKKEDFIKKMTLMQNHNSQIETLEIMLGKLEYIVIGLVDMINEDLCIKDKCLLLSWLTNEDNVKTLEELYDDIISSNANEEKKKDITKEKQVDITPNGVYYTCPHCNKQMRVDYQCSYCPECGCKLNWNDVNEYREINSHHCFNEDTDSFCKYYNKYCNGSKDCNYVKCNSMMNKYIGRLTSAERNLLLSEKGYKR